MSPTALYSLLLCVLYGLVVLGYAWRFRGSGKKEAPLTRLALVVTILAHLGFLLLLVLGTREPPVSTFSSALSALALGLAFAYFLVEWLSREKNMGLWVMSLPLVFQIIATTQIGSEGPAGELPQTPLLGIHIAAALIGYCAFSLSAAFSVMYLLLYHQIKIHHLGLIFERLPSLEKLETMGYRAVHFGLGFLLISVILGEWLLYKREGEIVLAETKIVVAVFACIIYGLAILMRQSLSIQGKRFALISIAGFALILFSLLIVDAFLGGFHQF